MVLSLPDIITLFIAALSIYVGWSLFILFGGWSLFGVWFEDLLVYCGVIPRCQECGSTDSVNDEYTGWKSYCANCNAKMT